MTSLPTSSTPPSKSASSNGLALAGSGSSNKGNAPEEDGFNPRAAFQVARRRWWLIVLVAGLVGGFQWYRVLKQPSRYQSQAELLVEPIAGEQEVAQLNEVITTIRSSGIDYPTQIEVLKSSKVMRPIHEKLSKDPDLKQFGGSLSYGQLVGNLKIFRLGETKILRLFYEDNDADRAQLILDKIVREYILYSVEEQKLGQREGLSLVERQLPNLYDRVDGVQERLETFRRANNVINPVALGESLTASLTTIREQRGAARVALQEAESLKANLEQRLGVALPEAITTVTLGESPRYQGFLAELQEIETEIALELTRFKPESPNIQVLEERKATIQALLTQEANAILGDQPIPDIPTDTDSASAQERLAVSNPIRLQFTQQLVDATNSIETLKVRQEALAAAESRIRSSLDEIAELARSYQNIEIELDVATQSLNRFLALRERFQVESVQSTLPWQVLESPHAGTLISGDLQRGLALGVLVGLAAGIAAAYLAEKIDTKYHSPEVLKESTGLPLLAVIPFQRGLQSPSLSAPKSGGRRNRALKAGDTEANEERERLHISQENRSFPFQEAFRSLQTNLAFMNPGRPLRTVTISSCIPKEGKSTTSTYLAQAAAAMGQKVLLVDADMRRPSIHQLMELPNTCGLSNVISTTKLNANGDIEESPLLLPGNAIQTSPLSDNLYVLTSGPTPPDAARLLSSQVMTALIAEWKKEGAFDLVVFDTPPLGGLADAKLLATNTDGLIMVVGLGVVDRSLLREVLDGLKLSRSSLLGILANSRKSASVDTSYHYSYYYHYYLSDRPPSARKNAARRHDATSSKSAEEEVVSARKRDNSGK